MHASRGPVGQSGKVTVNAMSRNAQHYERSFHEYDETIVFPGYLWGLSKEKIREQLGDLVQQAATLVNECGKPYNSHHNHVGTLSASESREVELRVATEASLMR